MKPYILALYLFEHSLILSRLSGYVLPSGKSFVTPCASFFPVVSITNLLSCECGVHVAPLTGSRCVFHCITHTPMRAQWSSRCLISPGLPPTYAHIHTSFTSYTHYFHNKPTISQDWRSFKDRETETKTELSVKLRSVHSHKETHHKPKVETTRSFKFLSRNTFFSEAFLKRMLHKRLYF